MIFPSVFNSLNIFVKSFLSIPVLSAISEGLTGFPAAFMEFNTLLHTGLGGFFLFLVFAHLAAFGIKANLPLLPSMFTGYVNKDYAEKRHPLWTKTKSS